MLSFILKFSVVIFLIFVTNGATQDFKITIPLNKTTLYRDKQLYGDFITVNHTSKLEVNFSDVGKNLSFIIFQVHSHLYNITLYKNISTVVKGTNIGLHSDQMETEKFFIQNPVNVDLNLYIAVHGYLKNDPIPGGCNMEFPPVPINPIMRVIYNDDYVYVDAAPSRLSDDPDCSKANQLVLRFYVLYLPTHDFNEDVYFQGIIEMTSLRNLRKKNIMPQVDPSTWFNRRMVMPYPGTAAAYVAVAYPITNGTVDESSYSVYVPAVSYACSPLDDECEMLEDPLSHFLCASLFFIGFFVCFFGHRFFKTHTFLVGFLSGFVIGYTIVSLINSDLDMPALLAISTLIGTFIGAMRLVIWWMYGLPVISIIISSANVGFLAAALILFSMPDAWSLLIYLDVDINYWAIFLLIITLATIFLLMINNLSNFICCGVIGAYATILPIDFYLGTNLKYVLIYTIKRITVTDFYKALKMTTYQWRDGLLLTLWVCLSIGGFFYQRLQNEGKPPFPPPPRSVRAMSEAPAPIAGCSNPGWRSLNNETEDRPRASFDERTPLLS